MDYISLSRQDVNDAIDIMKTWKCDANANWFDWIERSLLNNETNRRSFYEIKRKWLNKEEFTIRKSNLITDIKKKYAMDSNIRLTSEEYVEIGNGVKVRECHLHIEIPVVKVAEILNRKKSEVHTNTYAIVLNNSRVLVKQLVDLDLHYAMMMCEMLQLQGDYHLYDCSAYELYDEVSIIRNLQKFKKII